MPKMTKGEYRVGIDFNPGRNTSVDDIKRLAATFIDEVESLPVRPSPDHVNGRDNERAAEIVRLKEQAQAHMETAAMYAVKAATKPYKE